MEKTLPRVIYTLAPLSVYYWHTAVLVVLQFVLGSSSFLFYFNIDLKRCERRGVSNNATFYPNLVISWHVLHAYIRRRHTRKNTVFFWK